MGHKNVFQCSGLKVIALLIRRTDTGQPEGEWENQLKIMRGRGHVMETRNPVMVLSFLKELSSIVYSFKQNFVLSKEADGL